MQVWPSLAIQVINAAKTHGRGIRLRTAPYSTTHHIAAQRSTPDYSTTPSQGTNGLIQFCSSPKCFALHRDVLVSAFWYTVSGLYQCDASLLRRTRGQFLLKYMSFTFVKHERELFSYKKQILFYSFYIYLLFSLIFISVVKVDGKTSYLWAWYYSFAHTHSYVDSPLTFNFR